MVWTTGRVLGHGWLGKTPFSKYSARTLCHPQNPECEDGPLGQCSSLGHTSCLITLSNQGSDQGQGFARKKQVFLGKKHLKGSDQRWLQASWFGSWKTSSLKSQYVFNLASPPPSLLTSCGLFYLPHKPFLNTLQHHANNVLEQWLVSEWCVYCTKTKIQVLVSNYASSLKKFVWTRLEGWLSELLSAHDSFPGEHIWHGVHTMKRQQTLLLL